MAPSDEVWSTRLGRERRARQEAESLLESKASELWLANQSLASARDELEEKVLQRTEALKEAVARAEEASRSKSDFLANMSHELRTPMNGVLGMATLLRETLLDSEQGECVGVIEDSARLLMQIINDILDLSKIESGQMDLVVTPTDIDDLIRRVVTLLAPRAEERGISLHFRSDQRARGHFLADGLRIRQVVMNLVGNALKFTSEGSTTISLGVRDGRILIEVTDTGVGIPPDRLEQIFDRFTQADQSTTRRFGGSGLGLTICRLLVEQMGGSVQAESTEGQGSTFAVELPLKRVEAEPRAEVEAPTRAPEAERRILSGRVLLAEDNSTNARIASKMLERFGLEVSVVENGHEAVRRTLEGTFDLVLMDWHMPECSGLQATQLLRSSNQPLPPIIAMTASAMRGDRQACLEAGMDDFIAKPVGVDDLYSIVSRWLGQDAPRVRPAG